MGNLDRGFFGVLGEKPQKSSIFGAGTGLHLSRGSGRGRGRGEAKFLGFFGGKTPKIVDFRGGDGGHNIGDFAHSTPYIFKVPKSWILGLSNEVYRFSVAVLIQEIFDKNRRAFVYRTDTSVSQKVKNLSN